MKAAEDLSQRKLFLIHEERLTAGGENECSDLSLQWMIVCREKAADSDTRLPQGISGRTIRNALAAGVISKDDDRCGGFRTGVLPQVSRSQRHGGIELFVPGCGLNFLNRGHEYFTVGS